MFIDVTCFIILKKGECMKVDKRLKNYPVNSSKEIEKKVFEASLELERQLVVKELEVISDQFQMDDLIKDGVRYIKRVKKVDVHIGRVSVPWERPVFEGSINGKTVYHYPADELLAPPEKGRASYKTLSIAALLGSFVPYSIVAYIMKIIRGDRISPSSVQRYTETMGQFAGENLDEILENRKSMIHLNKDEILIASIDGSSSMINGNNRSGGKKKGRKKKKKNYGAKKK